MIAPTRTISPQRALLTVGAQILISSRRQDLTVNQAWHRFQDWRAEHGHKASVPFWWFALALDVLYALGVVEMRGDVLVFGEVRHGEGLPGDLAPGGQGHRSGHAWEQDHRG
ncbi:ABC-three component system middle component 6 [Nocardiopsis algeriensis]|uniref:Uncharacterized protein n=1 Tax=Nocardiopsis algeriensis TaxID=1478215 RepID=A0A841IQ34_9ACTN|nr:ABC-three component system middle component 6 [Nocardiopsis algeriensis]MBB6118441.1 hypothetical protein [Nocardiopsis algeriensis]